MRPTVLKRVLFRLFWLATAGAGLFGLSIYQNNAGATASVPSRWPAGANASFDSKRSTLILFAHPKCPCSRASVEELNRLQARTGGKANVIVYFFKPKGAASDWTHTDLWRSAGSVPGVTVREDEDGIQARLFGAKTSGSAALYDNCGNLLFHGGITGARGHIGNNKGEETVVALLAGQPTKLKQTPVFGCALDNECARPEP